MWTFYRFDGIQIGFEIYKEQGNSKTKKYYNYLVIDLVCFRIQRKQLQK